MTGRQVNIQNKIKKEIYQQDNITPSGQLGSVGHLVYHCSLYIQGSVARPELFLKG